MLAISNSLNAHKFPIFQPILMILVSKFMVHRALSDKTYLALGLLSPLKKQNRGKNPLEQIRFNEIRKFHPLVIDLLLLFLITINMSRDMCFPTMWHFDKCSFRRSCAASF